MSNTYMAIKAKFASKCPWCGEQIDVGADINWERGMQAAHVACGEPMPYKKTPQTTTTGTALKAFHEIADGTYTVVTSPDTGEYVTLEVSKWKKDPGKQIVSYLNGPDNCTDFMGFAFFDPWSGLKYWRRFKNSDNTPHADMVKYAVAVAVILDPNKAADAGEMYALKSSRCCRCQRKLTVPVSIHRGMGPICAAGGIDPE